MKTSTDHIVVTAESRFNETTQHGALTLHNDMASHNEVANARRKLEVVAVADNVADQVKVGDMVYVHFDTVLLSFPFDVDGMTCYKVCCGRKSKKGLVLHLGDVFAKEVDGRPVPLFEWVLVEPEMVEEIPILHFVNVEGRFDKKSRQSENYGTIRYMPDFKSNPQLEVGMRVQFHQDDAFLNDFNGEKLYTMKADRINMVIDA